MSFLTTNKDLLNSFIFEIVDRAIRLLIHLDDVRLEFYDNRENPIKDKLELISEHQLFVIKLLSLVQAIAKIALETASNTKKTDTYLTTLVSIMTSITEIHAEWFSQLPRPSEPIELRRFSRIIERQLVNINDDKANKSISIFVSEVADLEITDYDQSKKYIQKKLEELSKQFSAIPEVDFTVLNEFNGCGLDCQNTLCIQIARIDAQNPCKWPSLLHELAHVIYDTHISAETDICEEFYNSLEELNKPDFLTTDSFGVWLKNINLKDWLVECWCDLFATVVMGYSFWFSQYFSFISNSESAIQFNERSSHPPAFLRLFLIKKMLEHRFPANQFEYLGTTIFEGRDLIKKLGSLAADPAEESDHLKNLMILFNSYFIDHFFVRDGVFTISNFSKEIRPYIKYSKDINGETIQRLVQEIEKNHPIPSKQVGDSKLFQEPASVQEIILAGWLFRNNSLKNSVLESFYDFDFAGGDLYPFLECEVIGQVKRFDTAILRSIQVSEWFDLIHSGGCQEVEDFDCGQGEARETSLQVDHEILKLIEEGDLKIIPLINLKTQLSASSFDIRLGTSFQHYFPNQHGIIDLTDNTSILSADINSKLIDLDYLDHITISPGQFLLGHSMEYFVLPSNIAAEVDGRSSFARLGLEIHMTAGFIDPGFEGVLTFEIYNAGPNPIKLYPGLRIAQLRFIRVNTPKRPYSKKVAPKYSGLLAHHTTRQFSDPEVEIFRNAIKEFKGKN